MKRILKGLIFAFVGVLAFTLASCEEKSEHQPQLGWYRDASSHWHKCDHCDEQLDLAVHNYDLWIKSDSACEESRKCKTCGFVQTRSVDHLWGEWTKQEDGSMGKECSHCGQKESVTQYYVKGTINEWSTNEAHKLVIDYEKMTAEVTITLAVGDQFKVTLADSWDLQFNFETTEFEEGLFDTNNDGNLIAKTAADYKVVVSGLGGSDHKCTVTQLCVHNYTWTESTEKACNFTGVCSKCQATTTKVEHTLGEWVVETGKTCDFVKSCTKCDYKETKVEHDWHKAEGATLETCSRTGCDAINVLDYYIKGAVAGVKDIVWGASDAGKFTVADDGKSSSFVLVLAAGDQFKVGSKDGWEFNAGNVTLNVKGLKGTDNIECETAGIYVVTVSGLDTATHTVTIDPVQLFVKGDMNGWGANADYALTYDKETDTATITIEIADISKAFKVAPDNWDLAGKIYNLGKNPAGEGYVGAGDSGNITVSEAGNYIIKVAGIVAGEPVLTITKGEGVVEPVVTPVPEMWVRGSFDTNWATLDAYKLAKTKQWMMVDGKNTQVEILKVTVELDKDTQYKIGSADFSYSFGANATYAEGLFDVVDGNLKVKTKGIYTITITGLENQATAECKIVADNLYVSIAEALEVSANTGVVVTGKVKTIETVTEKNNQNKPVNVILVTLTDEATEPNEIKVANLGHVHIGDVVTLKGKIEVKEETNRIKNPKFVEVETAEGNSLNAELTKVTELSQLIDGAQVVLASGKYVLGANSSDSKYREIYYSADLLDVHQTIVTLVKSGDNWKLKVSETEYLYYSGSDNEIFTGVAKTTEEGSVGYTEGQADWTIAINEGVLTIVNVANNQRYLQFNIGSIRVAGYKTTSNQVNPEMYVVKMVETDETLNFEYNLENLWEDVESTEGIDLETYVDSFKLNNIDSTLLDVFDADDSVVVKTNGKDTDSDGEKDSFANFSRIELPKNETGKLSFTTDKKVTIKVQIKSTGSGNTCVFAVKVNGEFVACEEADSATSVTCSSKDELKSTGSSSTLYAYKDTKCIEDNAYAVINGGTLTLTYVVDASALTEDAVVELVSPESLNGRGVGILSISVATE